MFLGALVVETFSGDFFSLCFSGWWEKEAAMVCLCRFPVSLNLSCPSIWIVIHTPLWIYCSCALYLYALWRNLRVLPRYNLNIWTSGRIKSLFSSAESLALLETCGWGQALQGIFIFLILTHRMDSSNCCNQVRNKYNTLLLSHTQTHSITA